MSDSMPHRFTVELYAIASELAGTSSIDVAAEENVTAGQLIQAIGEQHPALQPILASCRLAVDDRYCDPQTTIVDPTSIAIIPPVSGG